MKTPGQAENGFSGKIDVKRAIQGVLLGIVGKDEYLQPDYSCNT